MIFDAQVGLVPLDTCRVLLVVSVRTSGQVDKCDVRFIGFDKLFCIESRKAQIMTEATNDFDVPKRDSYIFTPNVLACTMREL